LASVIINVLAQSRDPALAATTNPRCASACPGAGRRLRPLREAQAGKLMERVLELMRTLKLHGMRSAYDEIMGNGIKR